MAFTVMRFGSEIQVNSFGDDYQGKPSVAKLGNGRWVVTWEGDGPEGRGIYQQVYSGDGEPVFTQSGKPMEHLVSFAGEAAHDVSVAAFGDGWIVTWTRDIGGNKGEEIYMQRFNADGHPLLNGGAPGGVRVNELTDGAQYKPQITALDDGWLVTWSDTYHRGVYQQRYDLNGEPVYRNGNNIEEMRVNAPTDPMSALVVRGQDAAAIDGGVAVVWSQKTDDAAVYQIALQLVDESGKPRFTSDHIIATGTTVYTEPKIQALPKGQGFLVVWAGADSDGQGVFLQKFDAQGIALDQPLKVNLIEAGQQSEPSVEVLEDGSWIVTFTSQYEVFQRLYDSKGDALGPETPISDWFIDEPSEWNQESVVSYLGDGRWVAAWSNWNQGDDDRSGVSQRIVTLAGTAVLTTAQEVANGTADADILLVQADGLSTGDRMNGGDGDDTVQMTEGGSIDLNAPFEFNSIEIVHGSDEVDKIIANATRLSGIKTIQGGAGEDELRLYNNGFDQGSNYDLSAKTITDIESIILRESLSTVTVRDVATGLLVHGDGVDETVSLTQGSFSKVERYQLFRQGIETVKDASGTYVKGLGEILNLNDDRVDASVGTTVRLDKGMNAEIPVAPPSYSHLVVSISNRIAGQDRLMISETARVQVVNGEVIVDGVRIGTVEHDGTGAEGLEISLTDDATPGRVQELVRALSYKNVVDGAAVTGLRSISITLTDAGGSEAAVTTSVNVVNQGDSAPPSVVLRSTDPVTGADTALLSPFADVRIRDADSDVTVTIKFAADHGRLILPAGKFGTYDPVAGTYTVTGDPLDITDYIRTIQFDPRDRNDPVGTVEATEFEISVTDDGVRSDAKTVTVKAATANLIPGKPKLSGDHFIKEMIADNTSVGTVNATDQNPGDSVTYSLVGAEDAPFKLVTENGVTKLVVTNGLKLDYEQRQAYTFTIRATDNHGLSNDTVVTINIVDVNPESTAGSSSNDVFKGGIGKDTLGGGLGDDRIYGGLGNDVLTGNGGKDIFVFNTKTNKSKNVDTLKDFSVKDDSIWLDNAIFTKIGKGTEDKPGKLAKSMFWAGKAAHDSSDRILYDKASGALYYDQDGTGRMAQVKIATLKKGLSLTEKDLFVI
jgi:Ca2+-binding RTX toxin-like protein